LNAQTGKVQDDEQCDGYPDDGVRSPPAAVRDGRMGVRRAGLQHCARCRWLEHQMAHGDSMKAGNAAHTMATMAKAYSSALVRARKSALSWPVSPLARRILRR